MSTFTIDMMFALSAPLFKNYMWRQSSPLWLPQELQCVIFKSTFADFDFLNSLWPCPVVGSVCWFGSTVPAWSSSWRCTMNRPTPRMQWLVLFYLSTAYNSGAEASIGFSSKKHALVCPCSFLWIFTNYCAVNSTYKERRNIHSIPYIPFYFPLDFRL